VSLISGVGAEDSWQTSMGLGSEAAALQIKILSTTKRTKGVFSVLKKHTQYKQNEDI